MRLKEEYSDNRQTYSLKGALRSRLTDYWDGRIETALNRTEHLAEVLSTIIVKLHERNLLSDEDVLALVPGYKKVSEDDSSTP